MVPYFSCGMQRSRNVFPHLRAPVDAAISWLTGCCCRRKGSKQASFLVPKNGIPCHPDAFLTSGLDHFLYHHFDINSRLPIWWCCVSELKDTVRTFCAGGLLHLLVGVLEDHRTADAHMTKKTSVPQWGQRWSPTRRPTYSQRILGLPCETLDARNWSQEL